MQYEKIKSIIQITSMALGTSSVVFLVRSSFAMSAEDIARLATPKWGRHDGVAKNLVKENINTRIGAVFLIFSILCQMFYFAMPDRMITLVQYGEPMWRHIEAWQFFLYLSLSAVLIIFGFLFVCCEYRRKYRKVQEIFEEKDRD